MPLTCNIDANGKKVRFITGALTVLGALILIVFWAWPGSGWLPWAVVIAMLMMGGLALFEARAGWCIVRAMGFKTKI